MSDWKFTDWYKQHGEQLNDSRRDRYKTDPAYRKQVLDANRASRQRRRTQQIAEKIEMYNKRGDSLKDDPAPKWKQVEQDGQMYVTIGALAKVLNRSKLGVRQLEKKGHLPPTPFRNGAGERLYTPEMVLEAKKTLEASGKLEPRKTTRIPEKLRGHVRLADGSVVECDLFRIGLLAAAIGRSPITLEQMERRQAIPSTPLRIPPNRRVFTQEQIDTIKAAFDRRGGDLRVDTDKTLLRKEILKDWKDLKLNGAKVLKVLDPSDKAA